MGHEFRQVTGCLFLPSFILLIIASWWLVRGILKLCFHVCVSCRESGASVFLCVFANLFFSLFHSVSASLFSSKIWTTHNGFLTEDIIITRRCLLRDVESGNHLCSHFYHSWFYHYDWLVPLILELGLLYLAEHDAGDSCSLHGIWDVRRRVWRLNIPTRVHQQKVTLQKDTISWRLNSTHRLGINSGAHDFWRPFHIQTIAIMSRTLTIWLWNILRDISNRH